MQEKLYSVEEVAEYLGVAKRTVERWIRARDIGSVLIGRKRRVRESDLAAYLAARAVPARSDAGLPENLKVSE